MVTTAAQNLKEKRAQEVPQVSRVKSSRFPFANHQRRRIARQDERARRYNCKRERGLPLIHDGSDTSTVVLVFVFVCAKVNDTRILRVLLEFGRHARKLQSSFPALASEHTNDGFALALPWWIPVPQGAAAAAAAVRRTRVGLSTTSSPRGLLLLLPHRADQHNNKRKNVQHRTTRHVSDQRRLRHRHHGTSSCSCCCRGGRRLHRHLGP